MPTADLWVTAKPWEHGPVKASWSGTLGGVVLGGGKGETLVEERGRDREAAAVAQD